MPAVKRAIQKCHDLNNLTSSCKTDLNNNIQKLFSTILLSTIPNTKLRT